MHVTILDPSGENAQRWATLTEQTGAQVSTANSAEELAAIARDCPVDAVLCGLGSIDCALSSLATTRPVAVVVALPEAEEDRFREAARAGAHCCVPVPCKVEQLAASLWLGIGLADSRCRAEEPCWPQTLLSSREFEVYEYLVHGIRPARVAKRLFISEHTVRGHTQAIFRKLGVHSQIELMRLANERDPDPRSS